MRNNLTIDIREFKYTMRMFRGHKELGDHALLSCESGIVIIESGAVLATMRGAGEWNGRAEFSAGILKALAAVPPSAGPVVIAYADGNLRFGPVSIPCRWRNVSEAFIERVSSPGLLDLLAMDRSLPRSEIHGTGLARRITDAKAKVSRTLAKAAKILGELEISQAELLEMVEARVRSRLNEHNPAEGGTASQG